MNDKIAKAGMVFLGAIWVKAYGEYKYYKGKVDANNVNAIYIELQKTLIDALNDRIDKLTKEKEEA